MMTIHVAPNLRGLPHTGTADFDFQVKVFPNEAMLRACFVTVTPDQPEHIGTPEPYSLEELSGGKFKAVLGHHLAALLKAGILLELVGAVDRIIELTWKELGYRTGVVATGGLASTLLEHSRHVKRENPHLTLVGLIGIWEMNRKRK
jgi:hypothetical protein